MKPSCAAALARSAVDARFTERESEKVGGSTRTDSYCLRLTAFARRSDYRIRRAGLSLPARLLLGVLQPRDLHEGAVDHLPGATRARFGENPPK